MRQVVRKFRERLVGWTTPVPRKLVKRHRSRGLLSKFQCIANSLLLASLPAFCATSPMFEKDIRPILKAHCFDCHGEGDKLRGGVDLRLRRLMLKGGDEGPVIVPGKPDKSLLFKMVNEGEMPKRGKKLTSEEIALIKRWIASGAKTAHAEPAEIEKT